MRERQVFSWLAGLKSTEVPVVVRPSLMYGTSMTDLKPLPTGTELLERVQAKIERYYDTARFGEIVSLTPNKHYSSEVGSRRVFASSAEAKRVSLIENLMVYAFIVVIVPLGLAAGLAATAIHLSLGILAGVGIVSGAWFGLPALLDRAHPGFKVSYRMVTAWTRARRVLEGLNEENADPEILALLQEKEADLRVGYMTFDSLIGEVAREQAEYDFLCIAGLVEVLGEEAQVRRYALNSTLRSRALLMS